MALQVRLVAADHEVWTGEADMVIARTVAGDLGVLTGHAPLLGVLVAGAVRLRGASGDGAGGDVEAAVHGGFLSVAGDEVSILAEVAELADEIDVPRAQRALEEAGRGADGEGEEAEEARAAVARARARLDVAGAR